KINKNISFWTRVKTFQCNFLFYFGEAIKFNWLTNKQLHHKNIYIYIYIYISIIKIITLLILRELLLTHLPIPMMFCKL
ncbi:MAG: hypothetical protein N7Q72_01855, partial [Spiroplasma sp. Tabriz.8]|nr:hypothetical protein [Spiroplasma sp. Tabriz.8]